MTSKPRALLALLCAMVLAAAFAACGGGGGDLGEGAHSFSSGSNQVTGAGGHGSTSTSASGTGGHFTGSGGGATHTLTVEPATAMLTITQRGTPQTQGFTAKLDGSDVPNAVWSLDGYAVGSISTAGAFSTTGLVGGKITVTATLGSKQATALITVKVALSEDVSTGPSDPGVSATNKTALQGTPQPDPGASLSPPNATKILYPYDKTVMPRGLTAPLLQFSPGNLPPEDALVALTSTYFSWQGFVHVPNGSNPNFGMPQDIWDAALLSAGGEKLTIDVTKAAAGVAYGPAETNVFVAPGSLKGAVYYMTYDTPGLYSVRPGVQSPATLLKQGCFVCHSVSANGTKLALGSDDVSLAPQTGIYNVGSDGTATQLTQSPPGLGGDSRQISFATFTPDGRYVMRSQNNFWGGVNQLAWKIDDANASLTPATVVGLGTDVAALVPAISPDGKRYAFTNGPGEPTVFGTDHRSLSTMDLAVDSTTDTLTFSNRKLVLDNGPGGRVTKFVNFLPDTNLLVLQESTNACTSYDEMLPTWSTSCASYSFSGGTGRLYMVHSATGDHVELANANAGNVAIDSDQNYEPFPLQVTAGGYFRVVFTSVREYGNVYQGGNVRKQLWVAAISTNPAPGEDPSHPPFYLPNQSDTRNERGFWALEPCRADGSACDTGDECCGGFCRPSDPNDPSSARVCAPPPTGACSQTSEKCTTTADCCDAATGTTCIGGFCTIKSPQ